MELISGGASSSDVEIELSGLLALTQPQPQAAVDAENTTSSTSSSLEVWVLGGSKRDHAGRTGLVYEVQITTTATTSTGGSGSGGGSAAVERRVSVSGACSKPAKGKTTPVHCVACPATSFLLAPEQDTMSLRVLVDRTEKASQRHVQIEQRLAAEEARANDVVCFSGRAPFERRATLYTHAR